MTKRIEEVLGLPHAKDLLDDPVEENETNEIISADYKGSDVSSLILDPVGLFTHEKEMDNIIDAATQAHKDSMDLAFNMEPKNAASVLDSAAKMLELALKASQSKVEMKNKSIDIALKKEKQDSDLNKNIQEAQIDKETTIPTGEQFIAKRNDLLAKTNPKK